MDAWETIAERKIREAMEQGAFDNLPSKGKPVPLEEDPFEDPSLRMAHHLLRVNGFAPDWIEEACEIDRLLTKLRADLDDARRRHAAKPPSWQRELDGFRQRAEAINRRIFNYNLKCPAPRLHKQLLGLAEIGALSESPES